MGLQTDPVQRILQLFSNMSMEQLELLRNGEMVEEEIAKRLRIRKEREEKRIAEQRQEAERRKAEEDRELRLQARQFKKALEPSLLEVVRNTFLERKVQACTLVRELLAAAGIERDKLTQRLCHLVAVEVATTS